MKIEKGKLCYDTYFMSLFIAEHDDDHINFSNKIAVHCPTQEDWEYVNNVIRDHWRFDPNYKYRLLDDKDFRYKILEETNDNYHMISIEEFKKFYPDEEQNKSEISSESFINAKDFIRRISGEMLRNDFVLDEKWVDQAEQILKEMDEIQPEEKSVFNPQSHYDNTGGSLYKIATDRKWNAYIFDVAKRLERGGKKDPLKQEIQKSIDVLKIWLNEL